MIFVLPAFVAILAMHNSSTVTAAFHIFLVGWGWYNCRPKLDKTSLALENIFISRTDNLGDVVLTLPLAAGLKKKFPLAKIYFIGKAYTQAIIESCPWVDVFLDVEKLPSNVMSGNSAIVHVFPNKRVAKWAKDLGFKLRIGARNKPFHWLTCNKLIGLSRKRSSLHEAQLNFKLLAPFGLSVPELAELNAFQVLASKTQTEKVASFIAETKPFIVLHPKSLGSAREWPLENFLQLGKILQVEGYKVLVTGTQKEKEEILLKEPSLLASPFIDTCGSFSLEENLSIWSHALVVVANSTGPLHVASGSGVPVVGLFPPKKPMHPGRWAPLGEKASVCVVEKDDCFTCSGEQNCFCMREIAVKQVFGRVIGLLSQHSG